MPGGRERDNEDSKLSLSNYCGLGGYGLPQHKIDKICKEHDEDYAFIQKQHGYWYPYIHANWADMDMLQQIQIVLQEEGTDLSTRERIIAEVATKLWKYKEEKSGKTQEDLLKEWEEDTEDPNGYIFDKAWQEKDDEYLEDLNTGMMFIEGTHGSLSNSPGEENMSRRNDNGKSFYNLLWCGER